MHGLRIPVSLLLIVRAFELWVHDNDIRHAAGLRPSVPDPATLSLMSDLAARLLPAPPPGPGVHEPMSLHLVLTGPGGGTWDVAIGQGAGRDPGQEGVVIVTDAVGFRLAANRLTPAEPARTSPGSEAGRPSVLTTATTLALD